MQTALAFDDGMVVKFNASGVRQWGTYIGGSSLDAVYGLALDESDNVYVTGWTTSPLGIATAGVFRETLAGNIDIFLIRLNSDGNLKHRGEPEYDVRPGM